jgi:8-oxo-dGTP diphosphatase
VDDAFVVGVQAIVADVAGRYLFVQRARDYGTGLWCFPGGRLQKGESLASCAMRELWEEAGLVAHSTSIAAVADARPESNHHLQIGMLIPDWSGEPRVVDPTECRRVGFRTFESVRDELFLPTADLIDKLTSGRIY